jgi:hypothetical protein
MADPRVQAMFERNQLCNPRVDLSLPREGDHAIYWYNLHMVLVHTERFREVGMGKGDITDIGRLGGVIGNRQ